MYKLIIKWLDEINDDGDTETYTEEYISISKDQLKELLQSEDMAQYNGHEIIHHRIIEMK